MTGSARSASRTARQWDRGSIDNKGYVDWGKVRPAHYCGAPYGNMFVNAYETLAVDVPYRGPEYEAFERTRTSFFEDM